MIAHRAANELESLRRAEAGGSRLVEADVRLFHGRLEVRHLKTIGPVPIFWDKWKLAAPWKRRLQLDELLRAARPETVLMLDLKGRDLRLSTRVRELLDREGAPRKVTVCSRNWRLLEPFEDAEGVDVIHSVGSRRQLAALRARYADRLLTGVSIHRDLLDPVTVAELKRRAATVMTWPVAEPDDARLLGTWGVDGVIAERFVELEAALAG